MYRTSTRAGHGLRSVGNEINSDGHDLKTGQRQTLSQYHRTGNPDRRFLSRHFISPNAVLMPDEITQMACVYSVMVSTSLNYSFIRIYAHRRYSRWLGPAAGEVGRFLRHR